MESLTIKKKIASVLLPVVFIGFYFFTPSPKVIDIHLSRNTANVLIKNAPFTDSGKIKWWKKNKKTYLTTEILIPLTSGLLMVNIKKKHPKNLESSLIMIQIIYCVLMISNPKKNV